MPQSGSWKTETRCSLMNETNWCVNFALWDGGGQEPQGRAAGGSGGAGGVSLAQLQARHAGTRMIFFFHPKQ